MLFEEPVIFKIWSRFVPKTSLFPVKYTRLFTQYISVTTND